MKRPHWPSLAGALMLATVGAAPAAEFYVDASNATGTELGTQQSPFRTVQAAIDAGGGGDEVRVAAGTYVENLRIEGKALVLKGGYSRAWERDLAKNPTALTGAGGNAVINLIAADATIDGFRITGGTGSIEELPYGYHGGGIYSRDGSPTISNNIIENNDVRSGDPPFDYYLGGGVHVTNAATATIVNNVVRGNYAGRGAGIAVFGQAALIQGNTIEGNVAVGDHGGGMFIAVVEARITQNTVRRNEVGRDLGYGWGGGLIVVNPGNSAELSYNVVYENFAAAYGAGEFIDEGATADIHHELIYRNVSKGGCEAVSAIAVDGGEGVGSQATIRHCTVVGNVCQDSFRGNGLQVEGQSVVTVTNSIFWNNGGDDFAVFDTSSLGVTYTCSQESFTGTGNLSADPRFVDAATDDYRLATDSPCIDAGDPASPFDNEPADNGGRADMGRYGNATDTLPSDRPNDDATGSDDDGAGTDDAGAGGGADAGSGDGRDDGGTGGDAGTDSGSPGGGASDGGAVGADAGGNSPATNDSTGAQDDAMVAAALCPTAAAMLFSVSLIGARRAHRRRPASADLRAAQGRRKRTGRSIPLAGLALGVLGLTAPLSVAKDHHVATTGDDASGNGRAASPWGTIAKALEAAQSGDSIILHDGVYRESVRVRRPGITIKSAENEWAIIEWGFGTPERAEVCVMFDVDASHGTLQRLELVGGYYSVFLQTRWDWGEANRSGVSDILIEDCKIRDSGRDCIKITPKCDRVTIRRCEIYNSGQLYPPGTPFDDKNAEGIDVTSGNRVLVQDCYVHDTATTGIYFKGGATECVVERTRVSRCGQAGVLLGFDTSPEFFDTTVNPEYYECVRGTVRNCIIEDTKYAGIGFYAARDALAANNTIINTARVGHSPIYFGLTFQDWDPNAGRPANTNVRVVNNVVAQLEPIDQPVVFIRYSAELGGLSAFDGKPDMNNNLYFTAPAAPRFGDARPQSALEGADLGGWQAHISGEVGSFVADPLLEIDGHLGTASPAIDRGTAVESVVDDFDGEARGATPDIGADEFFATQPTDVPPLGAPVDDDVAAPDGGTVEPPDESGTVEPLDGSEMAEQAGGGTPDGNAAAESIGENLESVSGGLCPATALASLSLGLLGVRRSGQGRTSSLRRARQ